MSSSCDVSGSFWLLWRENAADSRESSLTCCELAAEGSDLVASCRHQPRNRLALPQGQETEPREIATLSQNLRVLLPMFTSRPSTAASCCEASSCCAEMPRRYRQMATSRDF